MHAHATKKAFLFLLSSILLLAYGGNRIPYHLIPQAALATRENDSAIQIVTFRLLAVENQLGNVTVKSAEHLIESLTTFNNWQNNTISGGFQYLSHIHLLSSSDLSEIDEERQQFYTGKATRANLLNETETFLTQKLPLENNSLSVRILYYAGDAHKTVSKGSTSYCLTLDQPVYDWELDQFLRQGSNGDMGNTLVILDACYSGGYVAGLAKPGRVILTACGPDENTSGQTSTQGDDNQVLTWFTGAKSATYPNGTEFGPLGILGAMMKAEDTNRDGWGSAGEIFKFASQTAKWYAANQTDPKTGDPFDLNPWAHFGAAGGAIPLIQYDSSKPFPESGKPFSTMIQSADPYRCNSEEYQYRMSRYSPSHAETPNAAGPDTSAILWTRYLSAPIAGSASIADGIVFIGTMDGTFHALDMTTGQTIWTISVSSSISSTPAVEEGIVIFASQKPGRIYAADEYNGIIRWTYEIPEGNPVYASPTIKDRKVFICSSDGFLRVFSLFEGSSILERYVGGNITSSPAFSGDTVFITGNDVQAFDESDGTRKWRFNPSWPVFSSPAIDEGIVYVGSGNDDTAFALDASTGSPLWAYKTGGWFSSPCVDSDKDLILLGCRDGRIYCLTRNAGLLKWMYITESANHLSAPIISADGLVYVGSLNNNFFCLDEQNGQRIWNLTTAGSIASSPVIIDKHVLIGTLGGYLYCFGPPFPTRDIAVLNVTTSTEICRPGEPVEINYSVKNLGSAAETFEVVCAANRSNVWVTPSYNEPAIFHTETVTLEAGEMANRKCIFNTSDIQPGEYGIIVQTALATDETQASNNAFLGGPLLLQLLTDLDSNGMINIVDIAIVARACGSQLGDQNWNPKADLDGNGTINIVDIAIVAKDFGKT
jgi:outer membrane protein assembly factor BamB